MTNLVDTHCHIHSLDYPLERGEVVESAKSSGVSQLICVGTDLNDSKRSVIFTANKPGLYATVGLHPHDAELSDTKGVRKTLEDLIDNPKVVAVGECGLDYFYKNSAKADQIAMLELQLDIAQANKLPVIFHVRESFDDFWPIFDNFSGLNGVIHSFTSNERDLTKALDRGLFIGVNGIATFTKQPDQLEMYKQIPLDSLLLETDAPFLTPVPFRGTICQPKHVLVTAEFLAKLRSTELNELAQQTTLNAQALFKLK